VKVYFTKGYTATSGVNVREAGSVELVRQDGYGYDETHHVVGRVDARFPNAVIPEGINTVAKAVPAEGYLFNTWILEGAVPADLSNPSLWNPEYNAALIRPTLTVKPFPGVTSIKLTAVFVRKVAAPVASLAHRGTRPQRSTSRCRAPVSGWRRTTRPSCVGALLKEGTRFGVALVVPK
jgi:hypothetical protein